MRISRTRAVSYTSQLRCDRCGAEGQHDVGDGLNNFLQIGFDTSWGSDLGDGNRVDVDLCHSCVKETLGPWLRIEISGWNQRTERRDEGADS